jgi:hypothetical protein
MMSAISDQDMNAMLAEESRVSEASLIDVKNRSLSTASFAAKFNPQ